jgi:hypothetical protein
MKIFISFQLFLFFQLVQNNYGMPTFSNAEGSKRGVQMPQQLPWGIPAQQPFQFPAYPQPSYLANLPQFNYYQASQQQSLQIPTERQQLSQFQTSQFSSNTNVFLNQSQHNQAQSLQALQKQIESIPAEQRTEEGIRQNQQNRNVNYKRNRHYHY